MLTPPRDKREEAVGKIMGVVFIVAVVAGFLWLGACAQVPMDPKLASVCHEMLGRGESQCQ